MDANKVLCLAFSSHVQDVRSSDISELCSLCADDCCHHEVNMLKDWDDTN